MCVWLTNSSLCNNSLFTSFTILFTTRRNKKIHCLLVSIIFPTIVYLGYDVRGDVVLPTHFREIFPILDIKTINDDCRWWNFIEHIHMSSLVINSEIHLIFEECSLNVEDSFKLKIQNILIILYILKSYWSLNFKACWPLISSAMYDVGVVLHSRGLWYKDEDELIIDFDKAGFKKASLER